MNKVLNKISSLIIIFTLIFGQATLVFGQSAPEPPAPPLPPSAVEAPAPPTPHKEAPSAPSAPSAPQHENTPSSTPNPTNEPKPSPSSSNSQNPQPSVEPTNKPTGQIQNGQSGDTSITTGSATNNSSVINQNNTNYNQNDQNNSPTSNNTSQNGNGAHNESINNNNANNSSTQSNQISLDNQLDLSSNTGNNSASQNLGDSTISTGDANTSGILINSVNTNVDSIAISEFDINDDHQGNLIIDFDQNCIIGCHNLTTTSQISGNGSDSQNQQTTNNNLSNNSFQNNQADIINTLNLSANSGNNLTNQNTGGDNYIQTGDANVSANVLSFANNNFSGNVLLGLVNIFGNLVGDIILPESIISGSCNQCNSSSTQTIDNNGQDTNNISNNNISTDSDIFQSNDAVIDNNLVFTTNTGNNQSNQNTNGENYITTGNTNLLAKTFNVVNSNTEASDIWLVLVNQAGQWLGQIMGAPVGSLFASSDNTTISTDTNNNLIATNNNGSDSQNQLISNNQTNSVVSQENATTLTNEINLTANTGNNSTSQNTNGDNTIRTGDANVVANLINFVNNNITSNRKLVITVVNVFGSWMGNFITPNSPPPISMQESHQTAIGQPLQTSSDTSQILDHNDNVPVENIFDTQTTLAIIQTENIVSNNTTDPSKQNTIPQQSLTSMVLGESQSSNISVATTSSPTDQTDNTTNPQKIISLNLAWGLIFLPLSLISLVKKYKPELFDKISQIIKISWPI